MIRTRCRATSTRQEDGERVSYATYTPPLTENIDGYESLSGGNALFRWTRNLGGGENFQLNAYYDRTNRLEPNLGEDRDTADADFLEKRKYGARQEFLFGAGARVSQGRFDEVDSGLVFFPFHRTDYLLGFLEDNIALVNNRLLLTAGSKVLSTNYTHGPNFEPSIRLMWTPSEATTLWAAFTHALRTPSDGEEDFYLSSYLGAVSGLPVFARFNANPNFAAEKLNGYEAGFRRLVSKDFYLDVATFYNNYHDLFSEDVTGGFSLQSTLPYPASQAPPSYILLRPSSRMICTARLMAAKSLPNGDRRDFGDCVGLIRSCACLCTPRRLPKSRSARGRTTVRAAA